MLFKNGENVTKKNCYIFKSRKKSQDGNRNLFFNKVKQVEIYDIISSSF